MCYHLQDKSWICQVSGPNMLFPSLAFASFLAACQLGWIAAASVITERRIPDPRSDKIAPRVMIVSMVSRDFVGVERAGS